MTVGLAPPRALLGLRAATAIVVANMIGTGVFVAAGFQAKGLGDPTTMILTWVVGGIIALCGAAAYAELGAMMPRVGGEYVYLSRAYHPMVGAMSGWASLTAGFSAPIASAALLFAAYLGHLVPGLSGDAQPAVAVALIVAVTALHAVDTAFGARVQTALTIAKTALIVAFIALGLTVGSGDWGHFASRAGGLDNVWGEPFAIALMYVSFAYSGWNAAAYIAGEIDRPQVNLPRALLLGTGLVMALYILLNVTFLYALSPETLAGPVDGFAPIEEVGDAAARALFGQTAGGWLSSLVALALVSAVSAMIMAGPRVYAAMAEQGALPRVLAQRSRRGVPVVAVLLQGTLAIAFTLTAQLGALIRYVGFTLSIFAGLAVAGVIVLRWRAPALARPYRTWGYPVTPVVFVVASAWIAYAQVRSAPTESLWVAVTLAAAGGWYLVSRRR